MAEGYDAEPLLLTALLDETAFEFFDRSRREHYPAALNIVPAHLMLFHRLPSAEQEQISQTLARLCSLQTPILLSVTGVQLLGRGVAYALSAPALSTLHEMLSRKWYDWLTLQDRQAYRPHVVIQNKVGFEVARELCEKLSAGFTPFTASAAGLCLWRYRGGFWVEPREFPFQAADSVETDS